MTTNNQPTIALVEKGPQASLPAAFCKQVGNGTSFKLTEELPDIDMQPVKANIRVKRNVQVGDQGPWAGVYITFPETKDPANADMPYSTVVTANWKAIEQGILRPSTKDPNVMVIGFESAGWDAKNKRIILS